MKMKLAEIALNSRRIEDKERERVRDFEIKSCRKGGRGKDNEVKQDGEPQELSSAKPDRRT